MTDNYTDGAALGLAIVAAFVVIFVLLFFACPAHAQEAHWERVQAPILHQGTWQSCGHAERVLEHRALGKLVWSLHLGPDDEFALYASGAEPEDGDHSHATHANLLAPAYKVGSIATWRGKRSWSVARLRLWVDIVRAGGSRDECQSFFIRIEDTRGIK